MGGNDRAGGKAKVRFSHVHGWLVLWKLKSQLCLRAAHTDEVKAPEGLKEGEEGARRGRDGYVAAHGTSSICPGMTEIA